MSLDPIVQQKLADIQRDIDAIVATYDTRYVVLALVARAANLCRSLQATNLATPQTVVSYFTAGLDQAMKPVTKQPEVRHMYDGDQGRMQ